MPTPLHDEGLDFLTRMFTATEEGWLHVFGQDHTSGERTTLWRSVHDLAGLVADAATLEPTCSVWFGMAPRARALGGRRGGSADCISIPALWVDIDVRGSGHKADDLPPDREAALALIADFPLPPTVIVDSGGGLQPYWFLAEPASAEEALDFLPRWGATWAELGRRRGWHVDNVFDLARIMRLPGTHNRKPDHAVPPPVTVLVERYGQPRFSIDTLDEYTLELVVPEAQRQQAEARGVPYIGPERPGDAFNAVTDPGELLERAGFHFHNQTSSGDRHYRAPHHPGRTETTGATTYPDRHTTIWSETFARAHGMAVRRPYDPFGLYVHIWHGGNWSAATTELSAMGFGAPLQSVPLASLIASIPAPPDPVPEQDEPDATEDDWARIDLVEALLARMDGTGERILPTILTVHPATPKAPS